MSRTKIAKGIQSTVTSKDGTTIAYQTLGSGPSVIVVPGAVSVADDYLAFATALASAFTVHIIERRGRGASGPQGDHYSMTKECEDVAAVQAATGASSIVGHSYGGLVALEASRNNSAIKKLAVYEPGVSVNGSIPSDWFELYDTAVKAGKLDDAFIIFIKAMNPPSRNSPNWLLKLLLPRILGKEGIQNARDQLVENLREHKEVARFDNTYKNYAEITAQTLLMSGGKTEYVQHQTSTFLVKAIPHSIVKTFPKRDHFGIKDAPQEVAPVVINHLS